MPLRRVAVAVLITAVAIGYLASGRGGGDPHLRASSVPPKVLPAVTVGPVAQNGKSVYGNARAGMLSPGVVDDPYRLYVPESAGTGIDVIDPLSKQQMSHVATGLDPQHAVPAYDLRTLYVTNDLAVP